MTDIRLILSGLMLTDWRSSGRAGTRARPRVTSSVPRLSRWRPWWAWRFYQTRAAWFSWASRKIVLETLACWEFPIAEVQLELDWVLINLTSQQCRGSGDSCRDQGHQGAHHEGQVWDNHHHQNNIHYHHHFQRWASPSKPTSFTKLYFVEQKLEIITKEGVEVSKKGEIDLEIGGTTGTNVWEVSLTLLIIQLTIWQLTL